MTIPWYCFIFLLVEVRTHALVALGSCLFIIVSAFGFADILGTRDVVLDPSRIAAQVVSGIGFLGAGTILLCKEIVKGLTTAAAIWVVAAIGLACGAGCWLKPYSARSSLLLFSFCSNLSDDASIVQQEHTISG